MARPRQLAALRAPRACCWSPRARRRLLPRRHPHAGLGRIFFSRQWFAFSLKKAVPAMALWDPDTFAPLIGWADLLAAAVPLVVKQCT